MKRIFLASITSLALIGLTAFVSPDHNQKEEEALKWHVRVQEAHAESVKTNKPIFAFFTGSDWCGWCKRLQANVFTKPGFEKWANENVVLLELDFPRRKQLPADIAAQNQNLKNFFRPQGFPTVWIFNMKPDASGQSFEIQPLGSLGYPGSAPGKEEEVFLANANRILASGSHSKTQPLSH